MKIKVKKKALVSVLLSFVMIMGLFFVPQVNAEDQPDQPDTISFKATKANMETVDVYLEINGQLGQNEISYSPGLIKDHISEVAEFVGDATFQKAVVRSEVDGQTTENEILRVGKYNNNTYYSLTENEDVGIKLNNDTSKIILIFSSEYKITYDNDSNNGQIRVKDIAYYNESINVTVLPNDYYHIESITYTMNDHTVPIEVNNSKEMNFIIHEINSDVHITVTYQQDDEYQVTGISTSSGGICQDQGTKGELLPVDTEQSLNTIKPGETAEFMIYSQSWTGGDEYYLNMLTINGEDIPVPTTYEKGARTSTTIDESIITVELFDKKVGLYWKRITDGDKIVSDWHDGSILDYWEKERCLYKITITNVKSDLIVDWNFKEHEDREIILTGLKGIENSGMTQETKGLNWLSYWHFYYDFQPNNNNNNVYEAAYHSFIGSEKQSYNTILYSVKPGYNPYTVDLTAICDGETIDINSLLESDENLVKADISSIAAVLDSDEYRHFGIAYTDGLNYLTDNTIDYTKSEWIEKANDCGYTHGIVLKQHDAKNQIISINAHPYQYNLVFDLDGGTGLDTTKYKQQDGNYIEINDDNQLVTYTIENGSANTYMPIQNPTKSNYTFAGWQLCDDNGNPVQNFDLLTSNEVFEINENTIQYSSGNPENDNGHTFTFKAVWISQTASPDDAVYSIEIYHEQSDGTYQLNKTYSDIGTVNEEIGYIGDKNKHNNNKDLYYLNESISKLTIPKLMDETEEGYLDNNIIKLCYSYYRYDLTITKNAEEDYADLTRDWTIDITLTNDNDSSLQNKTFTYESKTAQLNNGNVQLNLKDGESFIFTDLIKGTQFTVEEQNPSSDYNVTYQINGGKESENSVNSTLSSDTTVTVINTMKDLTPDTSIPTSGMNSSITMLAIGSIGIIGVVILLWYWRKKHV